MIKLFPTFLPDILIGLLTFNAQLIICTVHNISQNIRYSWWPFIFLELECITAGSSILKLALEIPLKVHSEERESEQTKERLPQ